MKKSKPLENHREQNGKPIKAVVAPHRWRNATPKPKERKVEPIQKHVDKKPEVIQEESQSRLESPRQQKSQSTQVCFRSPRPIKKEIGTQYEGVKNLHEIEKKVGESKSSEQVFINSAATYILNSPSIPNSPTITGKNAMSPRKDKEDASLLSLLDTEQSSQLATHTKVTPCCPCRKTQGDTLQKTGDSLNTNITLFVANR